MREYLTKVYWFLSIALFAYPLWSARWATFVLTAWLAVGLVQFFVQQNWKSLKFQWVYFGFPFLFVLILANTLFATNPDWKYLERAWSLLLIPLFFFLNKEQLKNFNAQTLLHLFSASTLLVISWAIGKTLLKLTSHIGKQWSSFNDMISDQWFFAYFRTTFEAKSVMHPTYAGYFLALSCLFYLYLALHQSIRQKSTIAYVILSITALALIAALAAKGPLIFCIIAALTQLAKVIRRKKNFWIAGGVLLLVVTGIVSSTPSLKQRLQEIEFTSIDMSKATSDNSFYMRIGIYDCATQILKENWVWGVGIADTQPALNACYSNFENNIYEGVDYNTHNQLFSYWISLGLIGALTFIISNLFVLTHFWKTNKYFGFSIAILICGLMLTENILERQAGVITGMMILFLLISCKKLTFKNREEKTPITEG